MVLRCGAADPLECLHDHIRPFLREPNAAGKDSYRALATCHADSTPSLSVSVRGGRVVWHCFAKCGSEAARNAMIRLGVPAACLLRPAADVTADLEAIRDIVSGKATHAHKMLLAAAVLAGYDRIPSGRALDLLAESCGVSRREAYKARGLGLHP